MALHVTSLRHHPTLQEYLSQSRCDLAMLAHTLKGSLGYLGAPAFDGTGLSD